MLSPGCSRLRGLARGPALRAHTRLALAPQGPPPDTPVRLCVHRPEAQNQRRAALLGLLGAAAFARARALASRAPGPGSGRFSPLQFHRDFRASAACLTSRRAQRGSGWSDTSQRAAVTPDLGFHSVFARFSHFASSGFSLFFPSRGIPRRTDPFWQVHNHGPTEHQRGIKI
nr:uncharacterized protein LOC123284407 isoform X2 [Equus asinus]